MVNALVVVQLLPSFIVTVYVPAERPVAGATHCLAARTGVYGEPPWAEASKCTSRILAKIRQLSEPTESLRSLLAVSCPARAVDHSESL